MPGILDYVLLSVLALYVPIKGYYETARSKNENGEEEPVAPRKMYISTLRLLWSLTFAVFAIWFYHDRPYGGLGFLGPVGPALFWTWGAVGAGCVFLAVQAYLAGASDKAAKSLMQQLEGQDGILDILPKTAADRRLFNFLSLTAGFTEEIIYRGYLIWLLSFHMPVWAAAVASLVVFVLGHLYQRSAGAIIRVAATGAVFTIVYLVSGSLLPAMVLHAAVDLASNATIWRARMRMAE